MQLDKELDYSLIRKEIYQQCELSNQTVQQLIKSNYFINDIQGDIPQTIVPRISSLQIRSYLRYSRPSVLTSILKDFFQDLALIRKGEGFERFHANWERLYRFLTGKLPRYYFLEKESNIEVTEKEILFTHKIDETTESFEFTKETLDKSILLPAQGTPGLDIIILDKLPKKNQCFFNSH